jgi:hypothetical protein
MQGKKTYLIAALMALHAIAAYFLGWENHLQIEELLAAAGLAALRSGVKTDVDKASKFPLWAGLAFLMAWPATAAEESPRNFRAGELSVDLFAAAEARDFTRSVDYGGGVGLNYFITRGFGVGARALSYDLNHSAVDELQPRVIVRAPLWDRVAPYGYAQGIYQFERGRWGGGTGGGLELRLGRSAGLFAEAGLNLESGGRGAAVAAAGVRWTF